MADLRLPDSPDDDAAQDTLFGSFNDDTFPDALDGDFAIAAWDSARHELKLARDRVEIRPLFFARPTPELLVFASFPDPLIDCGLVEGRFRPAFLTQRILGAMWQGGWETLIEGVHRVPPGHVMIVGPEGERRRRYWRYPVDRASEEHDDRDSAARALRTRLENAVSRVLPRQGPICANLSSGLDSGAITALAARLSGRPPAEVVGCCFTMPDYCRHLGVLDEEPAARALARQAGVTFVPFPSDGISDLLLRPFARAFATPYHADYVGKRVPEYCARVGADRLICGFGGDEVVSFSGRGTVLADFLALRWRTLWRTSHELSQPLWRPLLSQAAGAFLPPRVEGPLRRAIGKYFLDNRELERTVRPGFRTTKSWTWPVIGSGRIQRARLERYDFWDRLEVQAWLAAQHGIRYVFPMLDWRLLEFAATLPGRLQLHGGRPRALFRSAVADLLPRATLEREDKLASGAHAVYQLALHRDALIAETRGAAASETASAVIDLAEVERQIASLPGPGAVAGELRAKAAKGIQSADPRTIPIVRALYVARLLAQNEADCAGRGRIEPEAA